MTPGKLADMMRGWGELEEPAKRLMAAAWKDAGHDIDHRVFSDDYPDCEATAMCLDAVVRALRFSTPAQAEPVALWPVGTLVRKRSGGQWHGRICGYYTTDLTTEGYAVESLREPGSVQIYPRKALELWEGDALPLLGVEERGEG